MTTGALSEEQSKDGTEICHMMILSYYCKGANFLFQSIMESRACLPGVSVQF